MKFVHFMYKKTERALKDYHGNEQEKPVGLPGSTEQVGGRRKPPSREQAKPGGHQGNVCRTHREMGLPLRNHQAKWQIARPSICPIKMEKMEKTGRQVL